MPRPRATDPPLGAPVFHILLALAEGALNGYEITQRAEKNSRGTVRLSPATLYENLHRLAAAELTLETDSRSDEADGRGQRFYELTGRGTRLLKQEVERLAGDVAVARGLPALRGSGPA